MAVGESGRHAHELDDGPPGEDRGSWRVLVARSLLVAGRVLPVVTIVVVIWSRLTRESWSGAALDDAGFTTAWLPSLAGVLLFCLCLALPFIVLPVGSTALSTRDGNHLTVPTVLGHRTVDLADARTWRASLPGRGTDTQIVLVRSSTGCVVLAASDVWLDDGYRILDKQDPSPSGWRESVRLSARGWMLVVIWVLLFFIVFGVGGAFAGTF